MNRLNKREVTLDLGKNVTFSGGFAIQQDFAWLTDVDPDFHMIEIGESMTVIAKRYLSKGLSVEEVSEIIQHPAEFVQRCI